MVATGPTTWACEILNPSEISELGIFLSETLPTAVGPNGAPLAMSAYFSHIPPYQDWEFIGALSNFRKTDIFHVSWPWRFAGLSRLVLKIEIELPEKALDLMQTQPSRDVKKELAKKTALNLFRYLESLNLPGLDSSQFSQALDRWYIRFEEKYKIDPNFMLRTD